MAGHAHAQDRAEVGQGIHQGGEGAEEPRIGRADQPQAQGGHGADHQRVQGEPAQIASDDPVDLAPHRHRRLDVGRLQPVDQVGHDRPPVPEEEEGKDRREGDDEGDQAGVGQELRRVAEALLDEPEQPALLPWLLREEPLGLRIGLDELYLEPVDADLEGVRQARQVRPEGEDLRAKARGDDGGQQDEQEGEAREQRGDRHRATDPEPLDPDHGRIQEVGEESGEGDRNDEAAEEIAEPHDRPDGGEPGEG